MKKTTVLLAEDHAIVREGLRTLLEMDKNFEVVGEAANGRQAVELARKLRPNIVVMDIAMPLLNGFEAARQILFSAPETKILVLSAHSDDEYVAHMISIGVSGYLLKQNSGQVLVQAVREIADGRSFFSSSIAGRIGTIGRSRPESGAAKTKSKRPLTSREVEVLQLVAEGAANKQVAAELGISIKTVEKHRQRLMDKLDIHHTAGLTRHAIATGVIEGSTRVTTDK
ncbi:MAG: response regulator transcription factor [Nibricoccus sp.]